MADQPPVTQITRDAMAQSDHDNLIGLTVLMQTILIEIKSIKDSLKDAVSSQNIANSVSDSRIRHLEDQNATLAPEHAAFKEQIKTLQTAIDNLEVDKNKFLGGWKTVVVICAIIVGSITITATLLHFFTPHTVTIKQAISP